MYLPSSPTPLTHSGTEVPSPLPIRELRSHLHYLFGHWGPIYITYSGTEVPSTLPIQALRSHLHYQFRHWGPIYITNAVHFVFTCRRFTECTAQCMFAHLHIPDATARTVPEFFLSFTLKGTYCQILWGLANTLRYGTKSKLLYTRL